MFSPYFKEKFKSSFWVLIVLFAVTWLVLNKKKVRFFFEKYTGISYSLDYNDLDASLESLLPCHNFQDELIRREGYWVSYDQASMQARYTIHILKDEMTKGKASRKGLSITDRERIYSNTPRWEDYIHTGFDRGHMVPAADFSCCQALLEDTFRMSNIAPFDSVLNRYAWQKLEIYTRKLARKHGQVVVITGTVQGGDNHIGTNNRIKIPSHFYKIIVDVDKSRSIITKLGAFLLPNQEQYKWSPKMHQVSIDSLEKLTDLDYFCILERQKQK